MISVGDIMSMIDVLREQANEADQLDVDQALARLEVLNQLHSEVRTCSSMIETAAKVHLESGSRQLGERVYALGEDGKWRYHHEEIDRAVLKHAMAVGADEQGEVSAHEAVVAAVRLMAGLYRSASTTPKKQALTALGFDDTPDIATWERLGKKIKVVDLSAPEGA